VTSQDRGHLRASHADREQVIEVLKAAFVQGRLTKDEFDARVGQTFASRTYAGLALITADIPADLVAGRAAGEPRRRTGRASKQADAWSAGVVIAAVLLVGAVLIGNDRLTYVAVVTVFTAAFVTMAQMLYSRHEQRHGRALPPRSAQTRLVAQRGTWQLLRCFQGASASEAGGLFLAERDHDFPAVGIADYGLLQHRGHPAGDPLKQLHLVRRVGADPEPAAGGKHLDDVGDEVRLGPGLLLRAERRALVRGLRAGRVSHR